MVNPNLDGYYYAVDLDACLMYHEDEELLGFGPPIPEMLERVKDWLAAGHEVRIFTARAFAWESSREYDLRARLYWSDIYPIETWCIEHIGQALTVTCMKAPHLIELWDDRAVGVEKNTGKARTGTVTSST